MGNTASVQSNKLSEATLSALESLPDAAKKELTAYLEAQGAGAGSNDDAKVVDKCEALFKSIDKDGSGTSQGRQKKP